ncbi:hypothetical protein Tco_0734932 [Tanacetum coccineum]
MVTQKPGKPKRKDTQVPQPSDPSENVVDEAVHKELGDNLVRAATTTSSLEAGRQETMGVLLFKLGLRIVLDLEKKKTTQHNETDSLKRRVKKLEKKDRRSGVRMDATDVDEEITLVSIQNMDEEIFHVNVLDGEEMFVAEQEVAVKDVSNVVSTVGNTTTINATTTTTATITTVDITLTQALMEIKSIKPKDKWVVIQELGESTTTISLQLSSQQSQDKGKGILIEPVKPMKKKDLIRLDEEAALKLQAKFYEKERLAREKDEKENEANIALIET